MAKQVRLSQVEEACATRKYNRATIFRIFMLVGAMQGSLSQRLVKFKHFQGPVQAIFKELSKPRQTISR